MKAIVYDPSAARHVRLGEAPEPVVGPAQVLVEVRAISLNFGELAFNYQDSQAGTVHGWDAAGVVVAGAADGSGPGIGSRVATFGWSGGWAEWRAVDVTELAVVADSVDLGAAATLPVAGVTALRALRRLGPVVGRRVLVTGASGGVGRFAVQLAARAGAEVVASVGSVARGAGLLELGASEVVVGVEQVDAPLFGVLDNVGGEQLAHAFELLEPGGTVQSIGMASKEPTTIDPETMRRNGGGQRLEVFSVGGDMGADLAYLCALLARGEIDTPIGFRAPWDRVEEAADALLSRKVGGKAVLDVPH